MSKLYDVIIIGSGPAGASAAQTLVAAGHHVAVIDGGQMAPPILNQPQPETFSHVRRHQPYQTELFLGENVSALTNPHQEHSASMVAGNRAYIAAQTKQFLPLHSTTAQVLQSLACGGLGEAWGGACDVFTSQELKLIGFPQIDLQHEYQAVIRAIGISGQSRKYKLQPAITPDEHTRLLSAAAGHQGSQLTGHHLHWYRSLLALLTKPLGHRRATTYSDLDYWSNSGHSLYRPSYTLQALATTANFHHLSGYVVQHFKESPTRVSVYAQTVNSPHRQVVFKAKKVILAAGSINTTKIVLASGGWYDVPVPFLTKSHYISPCLHWPMIGKKTDDRKVSLCQSVMSYQPRTGVAQAYAQLYAYNSLLLYKLAARLPLAAPQSLSLLSLLSPLLMLVDTRFLSVTTSNKELYLHRASHGPDQVIVKYQLASDEKKQQDQDLKIITQGLKSLGLFPLQHVRQPEGSTAHYAGGVPFAETNNSTDLLTTQPTGRITQFKHCYIADTASWRCLPAKPPTLTNMAIARYVAKQVSKTLT